MTPRETDTLLRELARDLQPVRPIPRLRRVASAALLLALPGAAWALARTGGLRPDLAERFGTDLVFVAIATGLALSGLGAVVAAPALAVPGREGTARRALALAATGFALALGVGTAGIAVSHDASLHAPGHADLACLVQGLGAGALASLALLAFGAWAAPHRTVTTAALAGVAGGALGGLVMHLGCPAPDPMHWIFGHGCAPWIAALAALPAAPLLRQRLRRA